jgi:hypothetical protein
MDTVFFQDDDGFMKQQSALRADLLEGIVGRFFRVSGNDKNRILGRA